jgi:hypothetical protein
MQSAALIKSTGTAVFPVCANQQLLVMSVTKAFAANTSEQAATASFQRQLQPCCFAYLVG